MESATASIAAIKKRYFMKVITPVRTCSRKSIAAIREDGNIKVVTLFICPYAFRSKFKGSANRDAQNRGAFKVEGRLRDEALCNDRGD
jgi:hypothetical protein